jgi:hypothetical protein
MPTLNILIFQRLRGIIGIFKAATLAVKGKSGIIKNDVGMFLNT